MSETKITIKTLSRVFVGAICTACQGLKGQHEDVKEEGGELTAKWIECSNCSGKGEVEEWVSFQDFINSLAYQSIMNSNAMVRQAKAVPMVEKIKKQIKKNNNNGK